MSTSSIRPSYPETAKTDAETICHHRRAMFRDMGQPDDAVMDAMVAAFRPWVERRLQSGEYRAWFAYDPDGEIIAGAGIWLMDWAPHMIAPGQPRANIINVYTEPAHRRKGLARQLMAHLLDWCRATGIRVVILHASREGRSLYEALGFAPTNEMRIILED